jgi:hypothetical protein
VLIYAAVISAVHDEAIVLKKNSLGPTLLSLIECSVDYMLLFCWLFLVPYRLLENCCRRFRLLSLALYAD